jgi:PHP family Zn ribbon phosphoesterase
MPFQSLDPFRLNQQIANRERAAGCAPAVRVYLSLCSCCAGKREISKSVAKKFENFFEREKRQSKTRPPGISKIPDRRVCVVL